MIKRIRQAVVEFRSRQLRRDRRQAIERYCDAWKRGDTRDQHDAANRTKALTTELLRLEMGR